MKIESIERFWFCVHVLVALLGWVAVFVVGWMCRGWLAYVKGW